jgi:hypothetical protein
VHADCPHFGKTGDDKPEHFAERRFDILDDIIDPQDWRRVATALGVIAGASRQ